MFMIWYDIPYYLQRSVFRTVLRRYQYAEMKFRRGEDLALISIWKPMNSSLSAHQPINSDYCEYPISLGIFSNFWMVYCGNILLKLVPRLAQINTCSVYLGLILLRISRQIIFAHLKTRVCLIETAEIFYNEIKYSFYTLKKMDDVWDI